MARTQGLSKSLNGLHGIQVYAMEHSKSNNKSVICEVALTILSMKNMISFLPFDFLSVSSHIDLNCSKPFEKKLTSSNTKNQQNRILFSNEYAKNSNLPLLNGDEDLPKGIPVTVYDKNGKKFPMTFKLWASKYYVLIGRWKNFSHTHSLLPNQVITVWTFHDIKTGHLCFAIAVRN
ncbi:hypothetical protein CJ030_MR2G000500 [Morella rubra]|uniref:TF-B3 domain-containing protein n=1 Tax=Morella rubra TaxID=262757 RepID=A0A6A1WEZ1_9ROSI|nr:hypothetical protein CJ030_MR2G000498 [Morella rubra]KAB1223869.1 hypothetical protein CJ030_MR2G000499 [Morella rubra]KAB1223870.1 hypothetical protein CJ030_MR2G000500 [Morella rubra]